MGVDRHFKARTRSSNVGTVIGISLVLVMLGTLGYLLLNYEGWFVGIAVGALGVYILFTITVTEWRTHFRRQANELDSRANTRAIDSLINYETVKYFGNEE